MFDGRNVRTCAGLLSAFTLLIGLYGCHGNTVSPVVPSTPVVTSTPPSITNPQVTLWTVTYTPVSLVGATCGISIGMASSTEPMTVALTSQTVDFKPGDPKYWEPVDFYEYTGTRTGSSFAARATPNTSSSACGAVRSETTVTGTFSDDGSHLSAQQVDDIEIGDAHIVRIYSWSADRQ
jgi:hypothetical protein